MERDRGVRAIGRGLAVLRAINQYPSLDMMAIARETGLPYPTACRIVETLIEEGMIDTEPTTRKQYRPTVLVQTLSQGYRPEDRLVAFAEEPIRELTRSILWPITVCSRVGSSMMIRVCTHKISPKTLNMYYPGYTIPILGCSAGIVHLAFCGDAEREPVLNALEQTGDFGGLFARHQIERTFQDVRRRGYGFTERCQNNQNPGKTSSVAAPILVSNGCAGAVTLTVYSSVMTAAEAAERHADAVCDVARQISQRLDVSSVPTASQSEDPCAAGRDDRHYHLQSAKRAYAGARYADPAKA